MPSEIAFPFSINRNGEIAFVSDEVAAARQHIIAAVGTHPTERVRRPLYGCQTLEYLFDSSDDSTADLLEAEIRRAVVEFVPEVSITQVRATPGDMDGVVTVELAFTFNRTGETATAVTQVRTAYRESGVVTEEHV